MLLGHLINILLAITKITVLVAAAAARNSTKSISSSTCSLFLLGHQRSAVSTVSVSMADTSKQLQHDSSLSQPCKRQQLRCPRCDSTDTKFCYYNNYSTAQPRHFCRGCRRYWTHGGALRDVPVGGGSRRNGSNKRRKISESSPRSAAAHATVPDMYLNAGRSFANDGVFLPELQTGIGSMVFASPFLAETGGGVLDFYDGLAPWNEGSQDMTSAWQEIGDLVSLELNWPPPDS